MSYVKSHFHYEFAKSFHRFCFIEKITVLIPCVVIFVWIPSMQQSLFLFLVNTCMFIMVTVLSIMTCVYFFQFIFLRRFCFSFLLHAYWYRRDLLGYLVFCNFVLRDRNLNKKKLKKLMPFVSLNTPEDIEHAKSFLTLFIKNNFSECVDVEYF